MGNKEIIEMVIMLLNQLKSAQKSDENNYINRLNQITVQIGHQLKNDDDIHMQWGEASLAYRELIDSKPELGTQLREFHDNFFNYEKAEVDDEKSETGDSPGYTSRPPTALLGPRRQKDVTSNVEVPKSAVDPNWGPRAFRAKPVTQQEKDTSKIEKQVDPSKCGPRIKKP